MIRLAFAALAIAAVASAYAQPNRAKSNPRIDLIWSFADGRILTQQDIWFKDGEYPACIQLLKIQAERWPHDYDVWTNLGWMQENIEHWDEALATYVRYRRRNPQDPDAALPEAFYFDRKKLFSKVPELLEPVIKRTGCHPNNFRILASSYEKMKMYADSVRVWKAYLDRASTSNDLAFKQGVGAAKHNLERVEHKLSSST